MDSKDELVKQHAKVVEDAVVGWEKAENEVVELKQKLEDAASKNNVLEDRVIHLDGALKECVRQLRQLRNEQEDRIQEAVTRSSKELQSVNTGLERRVLEIQKEAEAAISKNMMLRREFLTQREELEIVMIERDLSTQAAETASKQHLGSVKMVGKLEAECKKLRSLAKSSSSLSSNQSSDSHSDGGREKFEGSCSDSWASSALITEFYQFKSEKSGDRCLHGTTLSTEIDLMDDFLEMERLVALPETQAKTCNELNLMEKFEKLKAKNDELRCEVNCSREAEKRLSLELEVVVGDKMELEDLLKKMEAEKAELKISFDVINNKYQESGVCFQEVEMKLEKLQAEKDELDNEVECCREAEKRLSLELKDVADDKMELKDIIKEMEAQEAELKISFDVIRDKYQESGVCLQEVEMKLEKLQAEKDKLESEVKCCREAEKRLSLELAAVVGDKMELEDKLEKMEAEKSGLKISVEVTKDQYQESRVCFQEVEKKLEEIKRELKLANKSKTQAETKVIQMEAEVRKERIVSDELKKKCEKYEEEFIREIEEKKMIRREKVEPKIKQEDIETAAGKFEDCQKTIASLGKQLRSLATLEDFFLIDIANIPDSARSVHNKEAILPKDPPECIKTINGRSLEYLVIKNSNNTISPPCSSSSDSTTVSLIMSSTRGSSEKNRNGFATVFTRSRNAIHLGS